MANFLSKLLSMGSDRELKEFEHITAQVNDLEPSFEAMSEKELRGCTTAFRERYAQGVRGRARGLASHVGAPPL